MLKNDLFTLLIILALLIAGGWYVYTKNITIFPGLIGKITPSPTLSPNMKTEEVTVTGSSFTFNPNQITAAKGDKIRITFKVTDGPHNLTIPDYHIATKTMTAGQQQTIEFIANKAGTFPFYCSYAHHKEFGMTGKFIVK